MLLQRASRDGQKAPRLIGLIVEAALSSEAVAAALYRRQPLGLQSPAPSGLWGRSKLIENTLLAECLVCVQNSDSKPEVVSLLSLFLGMPVAYSGNVDRCKFVMAKHFGLLVFAAYMMSTALGELELINFNSNLRRLNDIIPVVVFDDFVQVEILLIIIIMISLCIASFMHSRYIIPRYYACLNLPSAIKKAENRNTSARFRSVLFGAISPWFLNRYDPERRVPILLRPFVGIARINKIDEFIAFRSHARAPAE